MASPQKHLALVQLRPIESPVIVDAPENVRSASLIFWSEAINDDRQLRMDSRHTVRRTTQSQ